MTWQSPTLHHKLTLCKEYKGFLPDLTSVGMNKSRWRPIPSSVYLEAQTPCRQISTLQLSAELPQVLGSCCRQTKLLINHQ